MTTLSLTKMTKTQLIEQLKELKEASASDFISWGSQLDNLKARWAVHTKEWAILQHQVYELGKDARVQLEELRTQLRNI